MFRYLIAFLIMFAATLLPSQTTPRSGSAPSVNGSRTTLAPVESRSPKTTSGSSRDTKTQQASERSSSQSTTGTTRSSSSGSSQDATMTAKGAATGSYHPESNTVLPPRKTSTRPAYSNPAQRTAARTSLAERKKSATKPEERVTINWLTLEQAIEKSKTEKRKIFVDVYTTWCGWCKHMDSTTFINGAVAKYLNDHYYPVKFNAEQQEDITFKDKTYRFKKSGTRGHHELAAEWLNNRLTFPTIVFLDENMTLIQPLAGYQDAVKMEAIINYFATDSHKKVPWESYEKRFVPGN